jgi:hypothetical protein
MVVEGWCVGEAELAGLHRHCFRCFGLRRCSRDGDACEAVSCPAGCGARYHGCKGAEHELLCPEARVACLNSGLGCSVMLARRELARHLPCCPASVLACTQEWNRWPMHCQERLKAVPFRQRNPCARRGQLDYELALRDQAVVAGLDRVPRRTKLALRNNLTRRFPALPLPREVDGRAGGTTDLRRKSMREVARPVVEEGDQGPGFQHGIARVFQRQQEFQRRRWQEDVDTAILRTGKPVPRKYWEFPEQEKGDIHSHCAYCHQAACDKPYNYTTGSSEQSCAVVACVWGCGARLHHCKAFEHQMICPTYVKEGEYDWMHGREPEGKIPKKKKAVTAPPLKPLPSLLAAPCCLPDPLVRTRQPPPPPPPPASLHRGMRFDIKVETVTRNQVKPRAMYTFLCGAELRRDQWEGHCKNVHSDIHGGLNNWLEARCPLSAYGCGFSSRRLYPGSDPRAAVVFCQATQSFGIRPPPVEVRPGGRLGLHQLPAEVLQYAFSFLDCWSLGSVALVSQQLRSVACSLLDSR